MVNLAVMSTKKPTSSKPALKPSAVLQNAVPADKTFFKEVDDALQQEKLLSFWQTWRWAIVAAVAAVVAATAGWQGLKAYQRHQAQTLAEEYYRWSKLESPQARAQALPQLLEDGQQGYRALAVFAAAREEAKTDAQMADRTYGKVYNDTRQPQWLRDLARLNAAMALLGKHDTLAQEHLSLLVQVPDAAHAGPLYPAALELLAVLSQRKGDTTAARGYTERLLKLPVLPPDMRQRAARRLGALSTVAR